MLQKYQNQTPEYHEIKTLKGKSKFGEQTSWLIYICCMHLKASNLKLAHCDIYQQQSNIRIGQTNNIVETLPDVEVSKTKLINVESGHLGFNHLDH